MSIRTILITGASSGIGKSLALNYAILGACHLLLFGRNIERLNEVMSICLQGGVDKKVSVEVFAANLRDDLNISTIIENILTRHSIDLVIANAAVSAGTLNAEGTNRLENQEQIEQIIDVNIKGVIYTITPILKQMVAKNNGHIALIGSMAGFLSLPSCPAYSSTKGWIHHYGEALYHSLYHTKVNLSVICPGYVKTPMTDVNKFPMPFLMSADKAAKIIIKNLSKKRYLIVFPKIMYYTSILTSFLPLRIKRYIFNKLPGKIPLAPENK